MLLLDGHKSHVSLSGIEWAKQHNIILQVLPAHTSHLLQPLDVGCYGPLQNIYNNLCHKTMRTKECMITRFDVCSMACKAYGSSVTAQNLQSAFKKCGIYPLDKDIINTLPLKPSEAFVNVDEASESDERVAESEERVAESGTVEVVEEVVELERETGVVGDVQVIVEEKEVESTEREGGLKENCEFFVKKVAVLKKVKGERKKKKRKVLSCVVSGKTVTEDEVIKKIKDHVSKNPGKKGKESDKVTECVTSSSKKGASSVSRKRKADSVKEKVKKSRKPDVESDSQTAGPSRRGETVQTCIYVSEDSEIGTESESEISEDEKCCVCKKFMPDEARKSVSLIFTKWAQCDRCDHWVHLIYCTSVRVVRRVHCEEN